MIELCLKIQRRSTSENTHMKFTILTFFLLLGSLSCQAQTEKSMEQNTNPLLCDPATGVCEMPTSPSATKTDSIPAGKKAVKIIYFTDPICSSCWGIEPQLRRLKLEYGNDVEIEYHMGGLLPDWSYNSGGISKPSDVAHHWDEVSGYYQMPIDGDVWLEDPLDSSYPPSIAFKAAQLQDPHKALIFLRLMREMVFLRKQNIAKWEHISEAAVGAGLDTAQLKQDYNGTAKTLFQQDLELAKSMGVRGFPTIFVTDGKGRTERVYGSRPYAEYEKAIVTIWPEAKKINYAKDWNSLFAIYPTLTTREFAELSDHSLKEAAALLQQLVTENQLSRFDTKNGPLWISD